MTALALAINDRQFSWPKQLTALFAIDSLNLPQGKTLFIGGPSGCGKSSLLKIIAGISQPKSGEIFWDNQDVNNFRDDFNGDMQFLGHKNFLKGELTVFENLNFYAQLRGTEIAVNSALSFFDLLQVAEEKVKKLSAGWQQKAILALLLACPATIWLLDEPSTNLDKKAKEKLHGLIKTRINEQGLVIITTHDEIFFDLGLKLNLEDFC